MTAPGSCAICGNVRRCTTECGGGGWADSCERDDGSLDRKLRDHIGSPKWRAGVRERLQRRKGGTSS